MIGLKLPRWTEYQMFSGCTWKAPVTGLPCLLASKTALLLSANGIMTWMTSAHATASFIVLSSRLANVKPCAVTSLSKTGR